MKCRIGNLRTFSLMLILGSLMAHNLSGQEHQEALRRALLYKSEADSLLSIRAPKAADSVLYQALAIYDSLKIKDVGLADVYHALAFSAHNQSQVEKSVAYLKESIEIKKLVFKRRDHPGLIRNYILYGDILSSQNREHEAIDHLEFALTISLSLPFQQQSDTDMIMGRLSDSYMQTEDFVKSQKMKERVLEFRKKKYGQSSFWVGEALYRLGTHYRFIKDYSTAVKYTEQAEAMIEAQGSPYDQRALPLVRVYLGINLMHTGRLDEGRRYITLGVAKLEETMAQLIYQRTVLYENVALGYLATDQPDSALHYYQKVIDLNTPGTFRDDFQNPPIQQIADIREVHPSFVGKARALESLYQKNDDKDLLLAAYNTVLKADSFGVRLRAEPSLFRDKVQYQKMISESNSTGFRLSHKLYEITEDRQYLEEAFRFSETNKANLLLANLQDAVNLKNARVPDSIITQSENYDMAITRVESGIYQLEAENAQDSANLIAYQNELLILRKKREDLFEQIQKAYPNYYRARYGQNIIRLSSVQEVLKQGELLLNYHLDQENLYVFQLTQDKSELRVVPIDSTFNQAVAAYLQRHDMPVTSDLALKTFIQESKKLRDILLPEGKTLGRYDKLTIVPHEALSTIPFGTLLLTENSEEETFGQLDYLINTHEVSYANSASLLLRLRSSKGSFYEPRVLAFAPVFEEQQLSQYRGIDTLRSELGSLSWTQEEVKNIGRNFSTSAFLREEATESRFKEQSPDFEVVHVASHGLLDKEDPMFSRLVFTRQTEDSVNDGYLTTAEIFNMDIPAAMVVLSACNTGRGQTTSGEGVLSLAGSFFYAGSQSLVMTLWTANDQSTAKIMDHFYQNLADGESKSAALANAKRAYLAEAEGLLTHPYYWAHFVVNGGDKPLVKHRWPLDYWLVGGVFFLIILITLNRSRTVKK